MSTHIAVICSSDFAERLKSFEDELSSIKLNYYIFDTPQQSAQLVTAIKPCDAVFFSGPLSYLLAKDGREHLPVPFHYLKQDETAIATTLLSITKKQEIPIQQISIDLLNPEIVNSVLEDIGFKFQPKMFQIDEKTDIQEIVQFHCDLYTKNETSQAVTSLQAAYERLQQLNVPVVRMIDPRSSIIKGLIDTKNIALLSKSQSAKISVGYIQFESDSVTNKDLEHITSYFKTKLFKVNGCLFGLYSTQGYILQLFEQLSVKEWKTLSSSPFKMAFGFGTNIQEATQNANDALQFAKKQTAYIIDEHKKLLGPFPQTKRMVDLRTQEPRLVEIAKQTALSPVNLSKVIQFSRSHHSTEFTANDLQDFLEVSRRTTERILKKLVDHGFAKIVGEEMTYQQGRPRAIYTLDFPIYVSE